MIRWFFKRDELKIETLLRELEESRQNAAALDKGMDELQESYEMQILSLLERIQQLEDQLEA